MILNDACQLNPNKVHNRVKLRIKVRVTLEGEGIEP